MKPFLWWLLWSVAWKQAFLCYVALLGLWLVEQIWGVPRDADWLVRVLAYPLGAGFLWGLLGALGMMRAVWVARKGGGDVDETG